MPAATGSSDGSPPPSPGSGARRRPVDLCHEAAAVWLSGVRDAVTLHQCVFFLARSEVIRLRSLQCFVLNGVIFLGSILLFNWAVDPVLSMMRRLVQDDEVWATDFVAASFSVLYKVLWIYPIYCISFILNTVMYQEIADSALALLQHKPSRPAPPLERLINEAFRMLLNLVYIVETNLLYYVPVVGPALYFVHSCWLSSVYCFEYRWVHQRWTSNERLDYFERNWLYFAGFGFPVSFLSFLCPRFIDAGVFALLFPVLILTASIAEPRELQHWPQPVQRLPVFAAVQGLSCFMLRLFEGRLSAPAPDEGAVSAGPRHKARGGAGKDR